MQPAFQHSIRTAMKGVKTDRYSAIVGMILLPDGNAFKERLMRPVWGAANVATLVLWPLATVIQFGVGR